MRGTGDEYAVFIRQDGITPAHAGNSFRYRSVTNSVRDHPRTCGEQIFASADEVNAKGSPPHMRGTERELAGEMLARRITPAHAGNSETDGKTDDLARDHPRTCGEQSFRRSLVTAFGGSPPHMRGTDDDEEAADG